MNDTICIYHRDADGCAAAAVIKMAHPNQNIEFFSAQYGEAAPNCKGKHVIIVDFSYPLDILSDIESMSNSLVVYDHHKSAQNELEHLDYAHFDMSKSGATLVWSTFFAGDEIPLFLQYVEDRDLWKFQLKDSKACSVGLQSILLNVHEYETFINQNSVDSFIIAGKTILSYQEVQIDKILAQDIQTITIAGYEIPCINHTDAFTLSEVCGRLSKEKPFAACYFDEGNKRIFSLRSRDDGVDVSEIAKKYGGGGHRQAAGFWITKPTIAPLNTDA